MATRIPLPAKAKAKPTDTKRRDPRQERAKATIEAILEAAARILERGEAFNTNRIAEVAGISIGTLYQYFKNKNQILVAIARRQFDADAQAALTALADSAPEHPEPERVVIRALIEVYKRRRKTRRAAIDAIVSEGLGHERARSVTRIAQAVLGREASLSPTAVFVLTRAVNGVLRATTEEDSALLGTAEFEEELVRLIRSYVEQKPRV